MRTSFFAVVLALATAACGPSIKPAMKSATEAQLSQFRGGANVPAPASYEPQPWAKGQWIAYAVNEKDKPPAVHQLKVVEQDAEGIWVETETQDYYGHTITKVLYARMPRTAPESTDVLLKIITKKDDEQQQVMDFTDPNNPMARMMKSMMKGMAVNVVAPTDVTNHPKEDVKVAAGTFHGTAKFDGSFSFGPISKTVTGWYHPAVPLNGMVKSATTDGKLTMELLAFGRDGAVSALK